MINNNKKKGLALPIVVVVFLIVTSIMIMMFVQVRNNNWQVKNDNQTKEMYFLSKLGVDIATASIYATHTSPSGVKEEKKIYNSLLSNHSLVLEDKITDYDIADLSPDIEISIKIEYQDNGKLEDDRIAISSVATNTSNGDTYTLNKYIDFMGTKTEFK